MDSRRVVRHQSSVSGIFQFKSSLKGAHRAFKKYQVQLRHRLVFKHGRCNVSNMNVKKMRQSYLMDIFTTLIDIRWRWTLLIFVTAFVLSWIIFASIWWVIALSHEDLDYINDPKKRSVHKPCVEKVYSFVTSLLFSIETQHTIGYGYRHISDQCTEAIIMLCIQSCFGVVVQALMTGLVFAKISRPKKRSETLMFSKTAVINKPADDGDFVLQFRMGDMRNTHILQGQIRAILVRKEESEDTPGTTISEVDVPLTTSSGSERLFIAWPLIIQHKITKDSPLYSISEVDLFQESFELIVILEGVVESTGMTMQARTSYLPGEIVWGHRFQQLVTYQKDNGSFSIDFSRFHSTEPIPEMPYYSSEHFNALFASNECNSITEDVTSNTSGDSKQYHNNNFTIGNNKTSTSTMQKKRLDSISETVGFVRPGTTSGNEGSVYSVQRHAATQIEMDE